MINNIYKLLAQYGYQAMNDNGQMVFYRMFDQRLSIVQVANANTIVMSNADDLKSKRRQCVEYICGGMKIRPSCECLLMVVIDDEISDYFLSLSDELRGMWFVSKRQKRVIVPSNQSFDYFGLYEYLNTNIMQLTGTNERAQNAQELKGYLKLLGPVTFCLVVINIIVYLIVAAKGDITSADYMESVGGLTWKDFFEDKEYYRAFTCMFLHYGVSHLFSNMLNLLALGSILEKRLGSVHYFILYMVSGLTASFMSAYVDYYNNTMLGMSYINVSVGASGAIFGVIGGLIGVVILQKFIRQKKSDYVPISMRGLIFMAMFSVLAGMTTAGVDNTAHITGLIVGFFISLILALRVQIRYTRRDRIE